MSRKTLSVLTIAAAAGIAGLSALGQPSGHSDGPDSAISRSDPASLPSAMKSMARSLRLLIGQVNNADKRDENLALIHEMERSCLAARLMQPPDSSPRSKDASAHSKLVNAYRKDLIAAMRKMLDVEQDLIEENYDAAMNDMKAIAAQRDLAHRDLRTDVKN